MLRVVRGRKAGSDGGWSRRRDGAEISKFVGVCRVRISLRVRPVPHRSVRCLSDNVNQ